MIKKFLILVILSFVVLLVKAQKFPNEVPQGNSKQETYYKGAVGVDSGFHFRFSFIDTSEANKGFIHTIPLFMITVGSSIYLRDATASVWNQVGGSGGTGTVTGASNLSPLFTTSTPSATINFSLSNTTNYTLFGRGSGTGAPSYLTSIDSNWVSGLHTENYYNTKYLGTASNGLTLVGKDVQLGGTLTGDNTIDGGGYDFLFDNNNSFVINATIGLNTAGLRIDPYTTFMGMSSPSANTTFLLFPDSILLSPHLGNFIIDTLNSSSNATDSMMVWDKATGKVGIRTIPTGGGTPTLQQVLTAGSTFSTSNFVDADGNSFSMTNSPDIQFATYGTNSTLNLAQDGLGGKQNNITLSDSIQIRPYLGKLYIDTLNNNVGTKALRYNPTTGLVSYADTTTGGGGGVTTLAAIGSSPNANGATISGSTLNLEPASASFGGVVTTGTQIFAGIKTFPTPIFTTSAETPLLLGATTSGANLTLQSTSHATKGKILFGTSAYDEVNNRLGIQQATPTSKLQINTDANSVTQSDANGILLANATAATVGLQSISPPIVMQGNGWKTTATAGSQDVRFKMDVLPVQGSTNPTATWQLSKSINGAAYTTPLLVASTGDVTVSNTVGSFIFSAGTQVQAIGGSTGGASAIVYRTTDAGANVTPRFTSGASSVTAGVITTNIDPTNGFTIAAANGTRQIARAGINITNLVNTAASESADLIFLTQSAGGAMTEKVRILSTGETGIGVTPTSALHTTSFATAYTGSAVDIALTAVHQVVALTVTGKTATLPTAVGISGRIYTIKLTASGTGTVATTSSETIDGSTTYSLVSQYKFVTVQSDNSNWNIIGNN